MFRTPFGRGAANSGPGVVGGNSPLPGCDGRTEGKFLDAKMKGDDLGFRIAQLVERRTVDVRNDRYP